MKASHLCGDVPQSWAGIVDLMLLTCTSGFLQACIQIAACGVMIPDLDADHAFFTFTSSEDHQRKKGTKAESLACRVEALFKAHKDKLRKESYRKDAVQSMCNRNCWLACDDAAVCEDVSTLHLGTLIAQEKMRQCGWCAGGGAVQGAQGQAEGREL